jgi:hypothetical protein
MIAARVKNGWPGAEVLAGVEFKPRGGFGLLALGF